MRTIEDLDIGGRRVFLRVDFNVPLTPARGIADATRVRESLPTIKLAISRGARLVLASHLGKPDGKVKPELSLEPVAAYLAEILGQEIFLTDEPVGDGAKKVVADLRDGGVALLENLRFAPGEVANDEAFARGLASYADIYINDAFGVCHRAHASTAGIARFVPQKGAGLLLAREVQFLGKLLTPVERPFLAIIGGAQVASKFKLMESLLPKVNAFYVGGVLGNTLLKARGGRLGRSLVEDDKLAAGRALLRKAEDRDVPVILPRDLVAAAGTRAEGGRVVPALDVPEDLAALDIGPETARTLADGIGRARTIFWSGPMGVFEAEPFAAGTFAVARAVAGSLAPLTVVCGGDSVAALKRLGLADRVSHASSGGGAALAFLQGQKLAGLQALET